jgi:KaiC/GvpD/RAD55 family RecA-like ATPase
LAATLQLKMVKTYVDGFDDILGGGIPQGNVVLVQGLPGTMKSSLVYGMMYNNVVQEGLRGLYITLEQSKKSLENQMALMGFRVEEAHKGLSILDVGAIQKGLERGTGGGVWIDFLKRAVEFRKRSSPVDIIGLDSLEALEVLAKFQDRRPELFSLFEWLREQGSTSFLITESPPESHFPGLMEARNDEDYLADGIIHLKLHQVNDIDLQRRVRVVKMRSANHKTGFFAIVFEDGRFGVTRAMSGSF